MKLTKEQYVALLRKRFDLTESVNVDASYEARCRRLCDALNKWPGRPHDHLQTLWTYDDRVVAYTWEEGESHAWEITYTASGEGPEETFTFGEATRVERVTTYEPVAGGETETEESETEIAAELQEALIEERVQKTPKEERTRFTEFLECVLEPLEERAGDPPGGKRIRAIGITADRVNNNRRIYPRRVLESAIDRIRPKLNESAGQGRLILTGEAEHPSDKGQKPHILETVFRWDAINLNESNQVVLEGVIIPTTHGRDLQILAEFHVPIKLSQRGYGESKSVTKDGQEVDEITYLEITGYDAVAQPSDSTAGLIESLQPKQTNVQETKKVDITLEELLRLLNQKPEMLEAVMSKMNLANKKVLAESMGTTPEMLGTRLEEAISAKKELDERKKTEAVNAAILESTKDLPYGEMNETFVQSIREAGLTDPAQVSPLVESKLKEWDQIMSKVKLSAMGKGTHIQVMGPVFERETGQPEYTKAAWELNESLVVGGHGKRRDIRKAEFGSMLYTQKILKLFDEKFRRELIRESKMFEEAELTTDLNIPYTIMRTMIEQAYPELISANVFDFGIADGSPARLYFEQYSGETGVVVAVTSEVIAADHDAWVKLANQRLVPGTVTITNSGATVTYVEDTDYVIDYGDGKLYTRSTGAITDAQSIRGNYTYNAYRKGEMAEIERAKTSLSFKTLEIAADRLATQISSEAIVFSRSQMNYDAVGRTLANIMRLLRRKIDQDILYEALAACLIQPNNSGGTWTSASDSLDLLAAKVGITKTKVYNRFYVPTALVMSSTNADRLSNWSGYTRLGFDNAMLNAAGFAGSIKGLPIFATPEFSDAYIIAVNRELVMHRVYQPMQLKGPYPSYSNSKLVAADQYYVEEYNGTDAPVQEKGSYMKVV